MCKLHLCPMAYYAKNFHFYGSEVAQSGTAAVAAAEFNAQCYDLNVIGWVDDGKVLQFGGANSTGSIFSDQHKSFFLQCQKPIVIYYVKKFVKESR